MEWGTNPAFNPRAEEDGYAPRPAPATSSPPPELRPAPRPVDLKPSNPKSAVGASKLALNFVPGTLQAYAATAFYEGATKDGAYNWRVAGVQASTYKAAHDRHVEKWWNGEDADPKTKVNHLASAIACLTIILDAELANMLTDDRPPTVDLDGLHTRLAETQAHITQLHACYSPKHFYRDQGLSL